MNIYKDQDCDPVHLQNKTIAVIGYGSQGHAHALNLHDSGMAHVLIGLRPGSPSIEKAEAAGFEVLPNAQAAARADIVMLLTPDEAQKDIYEQELAPHMKQGAALGFAHGLNVHFGTIKPRADLDVFMVAPKGPGKALRSEYLEGRGLAALMAVAQDISGDAKAIACAYASAIGCGRIGIFETSFKDECETDLFGEQAVICGGISHLLRAGYETLVEAGYPPEMAYFECVHEAKLITDLIYERGLADMRKAISNTAEFGDYTRGARVINDNTRAEMKKILEEIQSGQFTREWIGGNQEGVNRLPALRETEAQHPIEETGKKLRALMPWLAGK